METYDQGYAQGKHDALNFLGCAALGRMVKRSYRDGYSDGYFDFSRQKKVW